MCYEYATGVLGVRYGCVRSTLEVRKGCVGRRSGLDSTHIPVRFL